MSHPDGSGVGKERMNPARGHPGGAGEEEEGDSVAPRLAIWPPPVCQPLPEVLGGLWLPHPPQTLAPAALPFYLSCDGPGEGPDHFLNLRAKQGWAGPLEVPGLNPSVSRGGN